MTHSPSPRWTSLAVLAVAAGQVRCSEYDASDGTDTFATSTGATTDADADADSDADSDSDADTDTDTPPPEDEDDLLLSPAQTDVYVFVANPDRDTVTRINVRTQQVDTTEVGVRPEQVATSADFRRAVVLNRGDDTVTVIEATTLEQQTTEVRDNLNAMALSPDGAWAILWHDVRLEDEDDPQATGLQSFNEASCVQLEGAVHFPQLVGSNPKMVRFTPDGRLAVIVSDDYLARIDLTEIPPVADLIELSPGVLDPPPAEEVIVAADGSFAWVRQFGATSLLVVDLVEGTVSPVPAGLNPTDLDLSPDGTQAVAVARDSDELWVFDASDPFGAPEVVALPDVGYGSLLFDPTGERAVVFTTASAINQYGVWDRQTGVVTERSLVKPVASMAITPTGGSLLVFHTVTDGPTTPAPFAGKFALTLVDLGDLDRTNPLLLPAEPRAYANSTTGELGYFIMEDSPYFEVLDYVTLLHDQYVVPSIPNFLGVLPDLSPQDADEPPAWISQEHELGRISFFDPDDDSLETLTGFELNSGIEGDEE